MGIARVQSEAPLNSKNILSLILETLLDVSPLSVIFCSILFGWLDKRGRVMRKPMVANTSPQLAKRPRPISLTMLLQLRFDYGSFSIVYYYSQFGIFLSCSAASMFKGACEKTHATTKPREHCVIFVYFFACLSLTQ